MSPGAQVKRLGDDRAMQPTSNLGPIVGRNRLSSIPSSWKWPCLYNASRIFIAAEDRVSGHRQYCQDLRDFSP
jgi:hypothetical protein